MGTDCLNKYIQCIYTWKVEDVGTGGKCHKYWKHCMVPTCRDVQSKHKSKLLQKMWSCTEQKTSNNVKNIHVMKTLRCVLDLAVNGVLTMSAMLLPQHVREGCYLVHGQRIDEFKTCVESNLQEHSKDCEGKVGEERLARCVRIKHTEEKHLIPTSKEGYLKKLKCCSCKNDGRD